MKPKYRAPTLPGEVLLKEFLKPMRMSQADLARKMGVHTHHVHNIVHGRRSVSAKTAVLLSRALGTTPELWMNLQTACDIQSATLELDCAAGEVSVLNYQVY